MMNIAKHEVRNTYTRLNKRNVKFTCRYAAIEPPSVKRNESRFK